MRACAFIAASTDPSANPTSTSEATSKGIEPAAVDKPTATSASGVAGPTTRSVVAALSLAIAVPVSTLPTPATIGTRPRRRARAPSSRPNRSWIVGIRVTRAAKQAPWLTYATAPAARALVGWTVTGATMAPASRRDGAYAHDETQGEVEP